jgi:hypothetical protein
LAVICLSACAQIEMPEEKPYRLYMIQQGGNLRGYPMVDQSRSEIEIKMTDYRMLGGMCYESKDWSAREMYINELQERLKSK